MCVCQCVCVSECVRGKYIPGPIFLFLWVFFSLSHPPPPWPSCALGVFGSLSAKRHASYSMDCLLLGLVLLRRVPVTLIQATGSRIPWTHLKALHPFPRLPPSLAHGRSTWVPTCTGQGADLQRLRGDHVPKPEGVPLLVDGEPVGSDLQEGRQARENRLCGLDRTPFSRHRPAGNASQRARGHVMHMPRAQGSLPTKPRSRRPRTEEEGPQPEQRDRETGKGDRVGGWAVP